MIITFGTLVFSQYPCPRLELEWAEMVEIKFGFILCYLHHLHLMEFHHCMNHLAHFSLPLGLPDSTISKLLDC